MENPPLQLSKIHVFPCSANYKIIHFIRHAEGQHNAAAKLDPANGYLREDLVDASITELGRSQCIALKEKSGDLLSRAELMVVSPMNRTIQTASESFPHLVNRIPWIAVEHIREQTGHHPCDKRLSVSEHSIKYPHIDFGHVSSDNDPLYDRYDGREPLSDVLIRCNAFMDWIQKRDEREIIVVTHSAFLRHLFNHVLHTGESCAGFQNCELRSFMLPTPGNYM
jgi:broad specificity phosphatase PhoE